MYGQRPKEVTEDRTNRSTRTLIASGDRGRCRWEIDESIPFRLAVLKHEDTKIMVNVSESAEL
jgi:hypothetical protein